MLNHGLYTDTLWSVPVTFVDAAGAAVDMSGVQYVADVYQNGAVAFTFRSTGADTDEGTIDVTSAATGVLTFAATETQHAAVAAGLYRFHLYRDLTDDIWAAEATLLIGSPGDRETYLKFDRTVGASVELPIVIGGGGTGIDLGNPGGPSGEIFDMGSPS
jgi:hypothetical protein